MRGDVAILRGVPRGRPATILLVLGGLLLAIGLPLAHLHRTTDDARVADHAGRLLREPAVRRALRQEALDAATREVVAASGLPSGPVREALEPVVDPVLGSTAFAAAWRTAAVKTVRRLVDDRSRTVRFTVGDVVAALDEVGRPLPAPIARFRGAADRITVLTYRRSAAAARTADRLHGLAGLGLPALIAGACALLAAVVRGPRRSAATGAGLAAALAGAAVAVGLLLGRAAAVGRPTDPGDRDVAAAVWDELLGGLLPVALVVAAAGLALTVVALVLSGGPRRPAVAPRSTVH